MKILKIIFFMSLFILIYLISYKFYAKKQAEKYRINKIIKNNYMEKVFVNIKKYIPDVENVTIYITTKLMLLFTFGYLGAINYRSVLIAIMFGFSGFLLPNFVIKIQKATEIKQIHTDLLNVVECVKVQMSSNIPLIIALKNIPELCRNKKLKQALYDMYLEYELNGYSLLTSINKMKNDFKILEMNMFLSAMEQQVKYGQAFETYENLIVILKEKYIDYIESETQTKTMIMTLGIIIVLINLAVMGCYPIIVEVNNNLSTMLS